MHAVALSESFITCEVRPAMAKGTKAWCEAGATASERGVAGLP